MSFKKILCPVDFSDTSRSALQVATELSRRHEATLTLFHAFAETRGALLGGVGVPMRGAAAVAHADPEKYDMSLLADWQREATGAGAHCLELQTTRGDPAEAILSFAQDGQFDLIVLGTHGKTGMLRSLLGTVTYKVVRNAPCSVLTIRSPQG